MTDNIKPIETIYKGYRFRSRLEARWAVFFDGLRVQWDYEPEGYQMSDGTMYLPDFYLPAFDYYVEVKGYKKGCAKDIKRAYKFCEEKKTSVLFLSEIPYDPKSEGLFWFPAIHYWHGNHHKLRGDHVFFQDNVDLGVDIQDNFYLGCNLRIWDIPHDQDERAYEMIQATSGSEYDDNKLGVMSGLDIMGPSLVKDNFNCLRVEKALQKARTARFEHGETPTVETLTWEDWPDANNKHIFEVYESPTRYLLSNYEFDSDFLHKLLDEDGFSAVVDKIVEEIEISKPKLLRKMEYE